MILLIGGEKGGTGKTTVAVNLAVIRANLGHHVLLLDLDRQASSMCWARIREKREVRPQVTCAQACSPDIRFKIERPHQYDDIIIDSGAPYSIDTLSSLIVAQKFYIPIRPSTFDLWTLDKIQAIVKKYQEVNPTLETYVLINLASTNPSVTEVSQMAERLLNFDALKFSKSTIHDRIAFRNSIPQGLSVVEAKPADHKAISEIQSLYDEIFTTG